MFPLQYDLRTAFEPVALLTTAPQLVIARKSHPANDLRDAVNLMEQIITESQNNAPMSADMVRSLMLQFFITINRLSGKQEQQNADHNRESNANAQKNDSGNGRSQQTADQLQKPGSHQVAETFDIAHDACNQSSGLS